MIDAGLSLMAGATAALHDAGGKSKPKWPADSLVWAWFSDCGLYRYDLNERWDMHRPAVMWLMMNPSVASVEHADPTLIKTGRFSRAWGYGRQMIANVHAGRATDSKRLLDMRDPVGPENDMAIRAMAERADLIILAYGQPPKPLRHRAHRVVTDLQRLGYPLHYLRLSQDGTPQHPLYLPGDLTPLSYPPEAASVP